MDNLSEIKTALAGKRVLVTGHTGFKGGWLSLWLESIGAKVFGLSLEPPTKPSMFEVCCLETRLDHQIGDIRNFDTVLARVQDVAPDVIFHMAAQPLVRLSYREPLETFASNVMGTAHVLNAVREAKISCAVIVISSDKCYENRSWIWGYKENDPLGGSDPYSASKAATEIVVKSWRQSYFEHARSQVNLASCRAGNVIGGGDWAADRVLPDCIRAFGNNEKVELRNPSATRPWQHVLEPLSGYLLVAAKLLGNNPHDYASEWNFGPTARDVQPVRYLVERMAQNWGDGAGWVTTTKDHPKEAQKLALNCEKATGLLGWQPVWALDQALDKTTEWFKAWHQGGDDMLEITWAQIASFEADMTLQATGH